MAFHPSVSRGGNAWGFVQSRPAVDGGKREGCASESRSPQYPRRTGARESLPVLGNTTLRGEGRGGAVPSPLSALSPCRCVGRGHWEGDWALGEGRAAGEPGGGGEMLAILEPVR
jgi:hypothetical protein